MLPSKRYFKSLDCPCFEIGFCDRPYCLFRHSSRNIKCSAIDNEINPETLVFGDGGGNRKDIGDQQNISTQNVVYKPTPISELNKLPVRNNDITHDKFVNSHFEGIDSLGHLSKETTVTKFFSRENINKPENLTDNKNASSDGVVGGIVEHTTDDLIMYSRNNKNNCLELDGKLFNEDRTSIQASNEEKSTIQSVNGIISYKKHKIKESGKIKILNLSRRVFKRRPKGKICSVRKPNNMNSSTIGKINYHKNIKSLNKMASITGEVKNKNAEKTNNHETEISGRAKKECLKPENNEIKISSRPEMFTANNEKEVSRQSECADISYNDESNLNKKTEIKKVMDLSDESYYYLLRDNIASSVSNLNSVSINENLIETKLSFVTKDMTRNFLHEGDTLTMDNNVEKTRKAKIGAGMGDQTNMMTPARRLLMLSSQKVRGKSEKTTMQQNCSTVKIRSVPNVKLLLQEKEKLLKIIANKYSDAKF